MSNQNRDRLEALECFFRAWWKIECNAEFATDADRDHLLELGLNLAYRPNWPSVYGQETIESNI
jgi:hypothetical protein